MRITSICRPLHAAACLLLSALVLAACRDSHTDVRADMAAGATARGRLLGGSKRTVVAVPAWFIDRLTRWAGAGDLAGAARCSVTTHSIEYITRDPQGRPQTASAGVLVPAGPEC